MSTLNDLVNACESALHSYTGINPQQSYLTAAIDADDLSFPVGSAENAFRGIAQVDDELVYVESTDDASALALPPYGRGYRGTSAAAHAINTPVVFDPVFPRYEIKRATAAIVNGLWPNLYRIKATTVTYSANPIGYDLPADCERVIDVKWRKANDALNYWAPSFGWNFDPINGESGGTGKRLNLYDASIPSGSSVRVNYIGKFDELDPAVAGDWSQTFVTAGLQEGWFDLLQYGITAQLIRFIDVSRLQVASVENVARSQVVAVADAQKVANQLYVMFQQRVTEERRQLLDLVPPQLNFNR